MSRSFVVLVFAVAACVLSLPAAPPLLAQGGALVAPLTISATAAFDLWRWDTVGRAAKRSGALRGRYSGDGLRRQSGAREPRSYLRCTWFIRESAFKVTRHNELDDESPIVPAHNFFDQHQDAVRRVGFIVPFGVAAIPMHMVQPKAQGSSVIDQTKFDPGIGNCHNLPVHIKALAVGRTRTRSQPHVTADVFHKLIPVHHIT